MYILDEMFTVTLALCMCIYTYDISDFVLIGDI